MPVDRSISTFTPNRPCLMICYERDAGGTIWRLVEEDGGVCQSMVGYDSEEEAVQAARRYLVPAFHRFPIWVAPLLGGEYFGWSDD